MNSSPHCDLSVIVPVYNEEQNLPEYFRRVLPVIESITANYEVIFVLDPCRDRTEDNDVRLLGSDCCQAATA